MGQMDQLTPFLLMMMSKTVKACGLGRDEEWTHDGGDSVKDDQEKEEVE